MCKIKMAVDTMVLDKVMLIPDQLLMYDKEETATLFEDMEYEDTDLTMFTIKSLDLVHRNSSRPEKGIMMRIVLKRKATMELMTTFLPTLLVLLLTFSGTFFKVELFGDAKPNQSLVRGLLALKIKIPFGEWFPSAMRGRNVV